MLNSYIQQIKNALSSYSWINSVKFINSQLVRRWDNAPHHPELDTFPDHVHVGTDMCQISEQHSLLDVLEEIDQFYWGQ